MQNIYKVEIMGDGEIGYYSSIAKVIRAIQERSITADKSLKKLRKELRESNVIWYKTYVQKTGDYSKEVREVEYEINRVLVE